ncbi:hypothetical protein [Clostridium botulinum]|uniref:hypothetical protein n=1 Tax=Clostridium botulinum TaxID=1491 RepID=UPI0004DAEEE1|nr:hypothetical protein [Clostridium botulinum]KEH96487.1 hypothetical protein Z953_p0063 [Clostridium botulinum D str. 16868]
MKKLVLSTKQVELIYLGESERFQVIKENEWEEDQECQSCYIVFKDNVTNSLYDAYVGKCMGAYNSEIIGNETNEYLPVEEKEVVVKKYFTVNENEITETESVLEV